MTTALVRISRPRRPSALPRLPRPRGLQGLARRPIPIDGLARALQKRIGRAARTLERRVMGRLESSGAMADLARAGQRILEREGKKATGRGGGPLGPERTVAIEQVLNTRELEAVGRLLQEATGDFRLELETILREENIKLYNAGGRGARLMLKVSGSFNLRNPLILDSLAERANLVSGISDGVFERIRTVLAEEFLVEGKGPLEVARVLEKDFDFLSRGRAERIARTETLAIVEEASHTLYEASGVQYERWLATLDGRERPTHFEAHGQIKAIDDYFIVGDARLLFPGDPDGPEEEIIQCRCTTVPIVVAGQIFSDASVWDGSNAPDEFSRERLEEAEAA